MTRQNLDLGTTANDGTGDTLRQAGTKINTNFQELYQKLGGDSNSLSGSISVGAAGVTFEGSTEDNFETSLVVVDPTDDRIVTLPDATGNIVLDTATQTLTNKTLISSVLTTPQINDASSDHQYVLGVEELAANREISLPLLTGDDQFVFRDHAQTLTNKTLTSPTLTTPGVVTSINDQAGAKLIAVTAAASAVNNLSVTNGPTGSGPDVNAEGTDTNVNLNIAGQGAGSVNIKKAAFGSQTIQVNGAASDEATLIVCNKGTTLFVTLDAGTTVGEYKIFTNKGAGNATITPSNFAQGVSFTLQQYEGCQVVWDGLNWYLIGNQSTVTIL